jgi:predicted transcriptional regulator
MTTISYIKDVIDDYKGVMSMMNEIIDESGYKTSYFVKYLNISRSSFYSKKKNNNFSVDEIEKIVALLKNEDEDEIQTVKELDEMKKTYNTISEEELERLLQI